MVYIIYKVWFSVSWTKGSSYLSASISVVYGLLTFEISWLIRQDSGLRKLIDRQIDGFLLIGWLLWLKNLLMQMNSLILSAELIIKEEEQRLRHSFSAEV